MSLKSALLVNGFGDRCGKTILQGIAGKVFSEQLPC